MPKGICCNLHILKSVSDDVFILFDDESFLFLFFSQISLPLTLSNMLVRYQMQVWKESHAGKCKQRQNDKPLVKSVQFWGIPYTKLLNFYWTQKLSLNMTSEFSTVLWMHYYFYCSRKNPETHVHITLLIWLWTNCHEVWASPQFSYELWAIYFHISLVDLYFCKHPSFLDSSCIRSRNTETSQRKSYRFVWKYYYNYFFS